MALLAYSCTQEELQTNSYTKGNKSFCVTVENPICKESRAHLNEDFNVAFDEEDKIAVFENNTAKSEYTYSGEKFSGTSSTEGESLDGIYALYPSSAAVSYNTGTLPFEQTYCENSFSNGSQIMYGQTDNLENGFNLKNMCGYVRLHLYGDNIWVKEITLSVKGENEYVSGNFQIITNEDGKYSLKMNEEGEAQQSSVKMVCPEDGVELGTTEETATVFYIAFPPQTYTKGFSITLTDIYGRSFTKTAFTSEGFTLERNHIKPMEALQVAFGENELKIVKGEDGNQYAEVNTYEALLKWGYTVNKINKSLGMKLLYNIEMPNKTIEEDLENKTYKVTDAEITITDGVPSGSNWEPIGTYISSSDLSQAFKGNIDGDNHTINGILIYKTEQKGVGFVREFADGSIKNLTINNSYIYSNQAAVGIVGDNRYNTIIENVHLKNSHIHGSNIVGGIVGYHYRRRQNAGQTHELLSYITNCTTDENTTVTSSGDNVGGICGYNYGAAIINCINHADVTGSTNVAGIVGMHRTYTTNGVNGYLLASRSTSNATITSTKTDGGVAGGLVGELFRDRGNGTTSFGHKDSEAYVVACYSLSTISANKAGSMIGDGDGTHYGILIASFADKKTLTNQIGTDGSKLLEIGTQESNHYNSYTEISQDKIDAMNLAIETYNSNKVADMQEDAIENVKCHYQWQYNANGWPTLVPSTPSSNN